MFPCDPQDCITGEYQYRSADLRPWDPHTDQHQYESEYQVLTRTRTKAPMLRTASLISVEKNLRKVSSDGDGLGRGRVTCHLK